MELNAAELLAVDRRPFSMAVAILASSFLSAPIAHRFDTPVMAPEGHRFLDWPRLGPPP